MRRRSGKRGLSLAEVIISVFFLGFVSLIVLTMLETAFKAQRRNVNLLQAGLIAQTTMAQIRVWAADPANFLGNWSAYNGVTLPSPDYPGYSVTARCGYPGSGNPGCALYSPCSQLESQWVGTPQGARQMPSAVVPVELKVSWSSDPHDSIRIVSLVGEPMRSLVGCTAVAAPGATVNNPLVGSGSITDFTVTVTDSAGRKFDNLLFGWTADSRYVAMTKRRDGRVCELQRNAPIVPPVFPPPPINVWARCWATYAGTNLTIQPVNVLVQ